MIKVVIADDHQMIIDGIRSLLSGEDIEVVGEAADGQALLDLLTRTSADVVLLDINMPVLGGLEVTEVLKSKYPDLKILVLTMYNKPEFIRQLIGMGVNGYLLKNTGKDDLLTGIRKVQGGENFFSAAVSDTLISSMRTNMSANEPQLTKREKEVLRLIAKGLSTIEIAEQLFVSTHTVDTHRKNLLGKLGLKNTAGLVRYAFENGYSGEFYD